MPVAAHCDRRLFPMRQLRIEKPMPLAATTIHAVRHTPSFFDYLDFFIGRPLCPAVNESLNLS
jgi:hypothetical protein